jgi:ribonuclease G
MKNVRRRKPPRREARKLTPLSKLEREMIVAHDELETRIAFLEEGRLAEYYYERAQERTIVGNIYKGRVTSVLPGLQAAFVDIGLEKSGFIHARDILTESLTIEDYMQAKQAGKHEDEDGEEESQGGYERFNRRPIQDLVKKGQEILVQVEKDAISTKGPRLTGQISVPMRLAVLIPGAEHSGVSHRIATEAERSRLKGILDKATPKGFGTIARTSAEGVEEEEFKDEIARALKIWKNIKAKEKRSKAPAVLHAEEGLLHRVARDVMTEEDVRVVIDAGHDGKRLKTWLATFLSSLKPNVELYKGDVPVFESLNLEAEIEKALRPKVWLKCGGYLVIEETEALVVVDVNTGRNVGKSRQDDTILKTNLEAAQEIARQLRLRDLGGIIVLDLIDMRIEEHKERVYLELAQALQRDRAKTSLRQLTDLGLIEMTRKRVRGSLLRTLCEPCPMCQHRGWVRSRDTLALRLQRLLKKARRLTGESEFVLELANYAGLFFDEAFLREQARKVQVKLQVSPQAGLKGDELRLVSPLTQVVIEGTGNQGE